MFCHDEGRVPEFQICSFGPDEVTVTSSKPGCTLRACGTPVLPLPSVGVPYKPGYICRDRDRDSWILFGSWILDLGPTVVSCIVAWASNLENLERCQYHDDTQL